MQRVYLAFNFDIKKKGARQICVAGSPRGCLGPSVCAAAYSIYCCYHYHQLSLDFILSYEKTKPIYYTTNHENFSGNVKRNEDLKSRIFRDQTHKVYLLPGAVGEPHRRAR
jgi:hypothetical protein